MIAVTACRWQYRRYHESIARWKAISTALNDFTPRTLEDSLPPYYLVAAEGSLTDNEARVMRVRDSRMGNFIIKLMKFSTPQADKEGILVNMGWVPEDIHYSGDNILTNKAVSKYYLLTL